jgi:uncharacterized membrane protein
MDGQLTFIVLSLVILAIIALLVVFVGRRGKGEELSKLTILAFVLIISGIVFGDDRFIGYGLIGAGVLVAVIDIIRKRRGQEGQ